MFSFIIVQKAAKWYWFTVLFMVSHYALLIKNVNMNPFQNATAFCATHQIDKLLFGTAVLVKSMSITPGKLHSVLLKPFWKYSKTTNDSRDMDPPSPFFMPQNTCDMYLLLSANVLNGYSHPFVELLQN